jgi:hypothetical protein
MVCAHLNTRRRCNSEGDDASVEQQCLGRTRIGDASTLDAREWLCDIAMTTMPVTASRAVPDALSSRQCGSTCRVVGNVRTGASFGVGGLAGRTCRLAGLKGWIGGGTAPCAFSGALSPTINAIAIRDMAKGRAMLWAWGAAPCGAGRGETRGMIGVRCHTCRMADKNSAGGIVSVVRITSSQ